MAHDQFLKIGTIEGESADDKHPNEIDVLSWSWGASQSGSMHQSTGGGSGKSSFQDIQITKYIDKSTPLLLQACAKGEHIDKCELVVRKAGGAAPIEYLKLTMEQCLISSISTGGSGGADRLTENITINFGKFNVEYTQQNEDGTAAGKVPFSYDIAMNKQL